MGHRRWRVLHKMQRLPMRLDARDGIDQEPGSPVLPIVELFCTQCSERVVFRP
jgi:hypothetical protein